MTFPHPQDWNLVVAGLNADGEPDFEIGAKPEAVLHVPGAVEGAWYWAVEGGHSLANAGGIARKFDLAGPNGSPFGVMCFPAHSAGKLDAGSTGIDADSGHDGDAAMHASNTIDYEVVVSGKVDVELPGGKVHTLVPGDLLVMAGVAHAWKNHYDEDCIYIAVTIGFNA